MECAADHSHAGQSEFKLMLAPLMFYGPWVAFVLSFAAFLLVLRHVQFKTTSAVVITMVACIAALELDSVIFGPFARNEVGDGQDLFWGYFPYFAKNQDALFLTALGGGSDRFALGRIGGELLSLQLGLSKFLPLWAVLVSLRIIVPVIAWVGTWLFAERILKAPRAIAAAAACVYVVFDFSSGMTFLYGLSVAGLPLLMYVLFGCAATPAGIGIVAVVGLLYASAADAFYGLPNFVATVVLLALWIKPRSWMLLLGGSVGLIAVWLLNYAEAIYAFTQFLPVSSRVDAQKAASELPMAFSAQLANAIGDGAKTAVLYTQYFASPLGLATNVPVIIAAIWSLRIKRLDLFLFSLVPFAVVAFSGIGSVLPWHLVGLGFLSTYRWDHMYYVVPILSLTALCLVFASEKLRQERRASRFAVAALLAVAASYITNTRLFELNWSPHVGNIARTTAALNLKPQDVGMAAGYRVIAIPPSVDRNVAVNAGMETYDVGATLVHAHVLSYWQHGIQKYKGGTIEVAGLALNPDFDTCCDPLPIAKYADLDLLKIANVRYILSYRQLTDPSISQLAGPASQIPLKWWQFAFTAPLPLFIYEIKDALPRAGMVKKVTVVANDLAQTALLDLLRKDVPGQTAVLSENAAQQLRVDAETSWDVPAEVKSNPIRNGYELHLSDHDGALAIVNAPYFPWWRARTADGTLLPVAEANFIHTAIKVPPHERVVRLTYERPTLLQW